MQKTRTTPKFRVIERKAELNAVRAVRPAGEVIAVRRALGIDVLFIEEYITLRSHLIACEKIWMHYIVVDALNYYDLDIKTDQIFLKAFAEQAKRWVHHVMHGTLDDAFFDELAVLTAFLRINNLPMTILFNGIRAACHDTTSRTQYSEDGEQARLRLVSERCLLKLLAISTYVVSRSYTLWQEAFSSSKVLELNIDLIDAAEVQPTHTCTQTKSVSAFSLPAHLKQRGLKAAHASYSAGSKRVATATNARPWSGRAS